MSIEERYGRAINSSHLEVKDTAGDVDVLIAAGWCGDGLGAMLTRLRIEFDAVRGTISAAEIGETNRRMLVMMRLRTLREVTAAINEMAAHLARGREWPAEVVRGLAWRALSAWLDPNCQHCTGRGFTGGYDGPHVLCRPCGGSGSRRANIGRNDAEREFAARIGVVLEREAGAVKTQMQRYLREPAI